MSSLTATFHGLDGFAGFRAGQAYTISYRRAEDADELGGYLVQMPHAPELGPARFNEKQWAEWWEKK